jgi:tRNA G18 (ribose-2'-O)-methylase SpoU
MANIEAIDDPRDPRLEIYSHLKATNSTRGAGEFVVEGRRLVSRLIRERYPVTSIVCVERFAAEFAEFAPETAQVWVLPNDRISDLVGYRFHMGALAASRRPAGESWEQFSARVPVVASLIACPRVDNPDNLGSLIRLADVFDIAAIVTSGRIPDPLSRRVLRVSMGTSLRVPVFSLSDLKAETNRLRAEQGFEFWAIEADPEYASYDSPTRPARVGYVFGCESEGLGADWLGYCDRRLTIAVRAGAESLNLSAAAAVVRHHDWRSRAAWDPRAGGTGNP